MESEEQAEDILQDSILVSIRIRPYNIFEINNEFPKCISINQELNKVFYTSFNALSLDTKEFYFDSVFDCDSTQEDVFDSSGIGFEEWDLELIRSALNFGNKIQTIRCSDKDSVLDHNDNILCLWIDEDSENGFEFSISLSEYINRDFYIVKWKIQIHFQNLRPSKVKEYYHCDPIQSLYLSI